MSLNYSQSQQKQFEQNIRLFRAKTDEKIKAKIKELSLLDGFLNTQIEVQKATYSQFIIALKELRSAYPRLKPKIDDLLAASIAYLTAEKTEKKLGPARFILQTAVLDLKRANKGVNSSIALGFASGTFFSAAGLGGLIAGSIGIANLLPALSFGFLGMAAAPWGLVALSVGLIIAAGIILAIGAYQIHKNTRLCIDSQLDEIDDFVCGLTGAERSDLQINPNYGMRMKPFSDSPPESFHSHRSLDRSSMTLR